MPGCDTRTISSAAFRRPAVLGLSGGIGSGKSSTCTVFRSLGVPCLDIDQVARNIHQSPDHPAMSAIADTFPDLITPEGTLRRGSLRTRFAVDASANIALKQLLEPYVIEEAERWTLAQSAEYVVWESALIAAVASRCQRVLVVDASEKTRRARVRTRNSDWSEQAIVTVMAMQSTRGGYLHHADDVVINEGSPGELATQVAALHYEYLKIWSLTP